MKKYSVGVRIDAHSWVEIEANSLEEAKTKAEDVIWNVPLLNETLEIISHEVTSIEFEDACCWCKD